MLGCQGLYTPTASVGGVNLFYDFSSIPDCATITNVMVRHFGGNSASDNVYHIHRPSDGSFYDINESTTNRVRHRSNTTTPVQSGIYNHIGVYPGNTFPTPAGQFESEVTFTTQPTVAELKTDFAVRLSALNSNDIAGCTKVIVDYTVADCTNEELEAAGCAYDRDALATSLCLDAQTVEDCAGNEKQVNALPTVIENVVNVRVCAEAEKEICQIDYFLGCDDVNNDGSVIVQFFKPIQSCYLGSTLVSQTALPFVDDQLAPYTPVNEVACDPLTLDFDEEFYCDNGRVTFIRRTIVVAGTGVVVEEVQLDGVTPYSPTGPITQGRCEITPTVVSCRECYQRLFQTYATLPFTIT